MDIIKRRIKLRDLACPFVFHRKGKPVESLRKAFQSSSEGYRTTQPRTARHEALGDQEL